MAFQLDSGLWVPQHRGVDETMALLALGKDVILQSPTGSGKTRMSAELLRWAEHLGVGGCFYVNRKILIGQTLESFRNLGLNVGVRAAEHEDLFDPYAETQVVGAPSEYSWCFRKKNRKMHQCGIVIIDEAHIQKGDMMAEISAWHRERGARIIKLSATPVGLKDEHFQDVVVAGSIKEFRDCGALVPAIVYSIEQPDLRKVKRAETTGEFILHKDKVKKYTTTIVGRVIKNYRELNPDQRPTMMYAPDVASSVYLTRQMCQAGHNWAHIDANEIYRDNTRIKATRPAYEDLIGDYKAGKIKGITSRFKCLDLDTEILTPSGWKRHDEVRQGSLVAGVGMDGLLRWEKASRVIRKRHTGKFARLKSASIDIRVTDDHEMMYRSPGCAWKKVEAKELASRSADWQLPVAAEQAPEYAGIESPLSDAQIALFGWMMTDGHFGKDGRWSISQSTSQPGHIHQHIRDTLDGCGIEYSVVEHEAWFDGKQYANALRYIIPKAQVGKSGFAGGASKDLPLPMLSFSKDQFMVFLYAAYLGDGAKRQGDGWNRKTIEIAKGNLTFLSRVQAMCIWHGMRANLHKGEGCHKLYITPGRSHAIVRAKQLQDGHKRLQMEFEDGDEDVWCVTVPSGNIVTRRNGKVAVVGNCREGIDIPEIYHLILATPIGSLQSYLQIIGRGLRAAPKAKYAKDHCIVQDHGGSYLRHGSPNMDRDWGLLAGMTEGAASKMYQQEIRNDDRKEPICCPKCQAERMSGITCPQCGHQSARGERRVIEAQGELRIVEGGEMIPRPRRKKHPDAQRLWDKLYYGYKGKGLNHSFAQMEAYFYRTHGFWPERGLKNMPKQGRFWFMKVPEVSSKDLH